MTNKMTKVYEELVLTGHCEISDGVYICSTESMRGTIEEEIECKIEYERQGNLSEDEITTLEMKLRSDFEELMKHRFMLHTDDGFVKGFDSLEELCDLMN